MESNLTQYWDKLSTFFGQYTFEFPTLYLGTKSQKAIFFLVKLDLYLSSGVERDTFVLQSEYAWDLEDLSQKIKHG